jgi:menaquinone-dependent protoporphyrinogen IX oxidase
MSAILILYSTVDGHTQTISERIARVIGAAGHAVTLKRVEDAGGIDLPAYD